jgi:CheY-like chemotaxis protein
MGVDQGAVDAPGDQRLKGYLSTVESSNALCRQDGEQDCPRTPTRTVEAFPARPFLEDYDPRRGGCLLLDVQMPQRTGLELQQRLNVRGWRIPVIFITRRASSSRNTRPPEPLRATLSLRPSPDGCFSHTCSHVLSRRTNSSRMWGMPIRRNG